MKAKELAELLLRTPDRDVVVFDEGETCVVDVTGILLDEADELLVLQTDSDVEVE